MGQNNNLYIYKLSFLLLLTLPTIVTKSLTTKTSRIELVSCLTNIPLKHFTHNQPLSFLNHDNHRSIFSVCMATQWAKTALNPGVNFINVKRTNFSYECRFGSFYYIHVTREKLPEQRSYKKFVRLTLMKLTTDWIERGLR